MMLLENLRIDPAELPQLEEAHFEPLEKDFLWLRLTITGLLFFILAGIGVVLSFTAKVPWLQWLVPWAVLLLLRVVLEVMGFGIKGYAIRTQDVSYKTGLLFFSMTTVPFNRIQHCEMAQGPIARLFDLAAVKIYTAGGSSSDITVSGLSKERAQRLRDYVTRLSSTYE